MPRIDLARLVSFALALGLATASAASCATGNHVVDGSGGGGSGDEGDPGKPGLCDPQKGTGCAEGEVCSAKGECVPQLLGSGGSTSGDPASGSTGNGSTGNGSTGNGSTGAGPSGAGGGPGQGGGDPGFGGGDPGLGGGDPGFGGSDPGLGGGDPGGVGGGDPGTGCAHSECTSGDALDPTCSDCAAAVCSADDFCCSTAWDSFCLGEVLVFCGGCP